jgi:hypothetical protein
VSLVPFLSGATTMGFALCALFFLRFWHDTRDSLFLWFACAFFLLGVGQATLALTNTPAEERSWIYLVRLAAFILILVAVARKNIKL